MTFKSRFQIVCACVFIIFFGLPLFDLYAVVERLVPIVITKIPHELPAFTQGLSIEEDQLYESTGLYGQSSLRCLDLLTGKVIKKLILSPALFAEGLAAFPQHLLQITWKEQCVFVYDRFSLHLLQTLFYPGEGWGLCRDEKTVWMSNGTSTLTQRDPQTFAVLKTLQVQWQGHPLQHLNDLECDHKYLYANIWSTNFIARIHQITGEVTGVIDCSQLLSSQEKAYLNSHEVLNGIAFRAKTGTFFLTGKGWPWIFEVQFVPQKL